MSTLRVVSCNPWIDLGVPLKRSTNYTNYTNKVLVANPGRLTTQAHHPYHYVFEKQAIQLPISEAKE